MMDNNSLGSNPSNSSTISFSSNPSNSSSYSSISGSDVSSRSQRSLGSLRTDEGGIEADTFEQDEPEKRRNNLRRVYMNNEPEPFHETQLTTFKKSLRMYILPKVKFVKDNTKNLGSYDKPDFTDRNCWQNVLFSKMGMLANASDGKKARTWMAYKRKLKMEFSNVRAHVTKRIKANFMNGKYI